MLRKVLTVAALATGGVLLFSPAAAMADDCPPRALVVSGGYGNGYGNNDCVLANPCGGYGGGYGNGYGNAVAVAYPVGYGNYGNDYSDGGGYGNTKIGLINDSNLLSGIGILGIGSAS